MLPPHLQPRLDRELDEGEAVNWVAQPAYRILKKSATHAWLAGGIVAGLFSAMFAMLAILESLTPKNQRDNSPLGLAIAAGVVLALWLASYHLFRRWAISASKNTVYAVTDKRVIILNINHDKSITERDYRGDELIHLARTEFPDGSGTLTFESARGAGHTAQTAARYRFHAIENVLDVERMLRSQFCGS